MSTKTEIGNMALINLGVTQLMTDIDVDDSAEAITLRTIFDTQRDFILREFSWPFATAYATLLQAAADPNSDWAFSYRCPSNALAVRRLVTVTGGRQEINPPAFKMGRDALFASAAAWSGATAYTVGQVVSSVSIVYQSILAGTNHIPPNATYWTVVADVRLIFTDEASAQIEYTLGVTDPEEFDPVFVSMLAWRLAAFAAVPLSRLPELAKSCLAMYGSELAEAKDRAEAEAQKDFPSETVSAREKEIVHLALMRLGVPRTDGKPGAETAAEARLVHLAFETERDFVLRNFSWPFATGYAALLLAYGTADEPYNDDWIFAYRHPAGAFVRRIVTPAGLSEIDPAPYRIGRDPAFDAAGAWSGATAYVEGDLVSLTGVVYQSILAGTNHTPPNATYWTVVPDEQLVFTNYDSEVTVEYTAAVTDPDKWDALFVSMIAWKLAAVLAPSRVEAKWVSNARNEALQMYGYESAQAGVRALNEGQGDEPPDAEWIRER